MRLVGSFAFLGFLMLLLRVVIVSDVVTETTKCELSFIPLAEAARQGNYALEQQRLHETSAQCMTAELKAKAGQALLAPSTLER